MPSYLGFTVQIICDGVPLDEFEVLQDSQTANQVNCWIPSELGKKFIVKASYRGPITSNADLKLFCDGEGVRSKAWYSLDSPLSVDYARIKSIKYNLVFGSIKMTDDDETIGSVSQGEQLGNIEVEIRKAEVAGNTLEPYDFQPIPDAWSNLVDEKAKKGGMHRVKLEDPKVPSESHRFVCHYKSIEKQPWVKFRFRYRPRAMLQAMGIIPQPTSAPATTSRAAKRKASTTLDDQNVIKIEDSEEEIEALEAKLQKLRSVKKIKKESTTIIVPTPREIIELSD